MIIEAKIRNVGEKFKSISVKLPDEAGEKFKDFAVEIVNIPNRGITSIFLVKDNEDKYSVTFDTFLKDAFPNGFKALYEKLTAPTL